MSFEARMVQALQELQSLSRFRELSLPEGISFSHNDYLGLAGHPAIVDAGLAALSIGGTGSRGSRLLGGHSRAFEEAEERIARFFGAPAALFFSSGYLANLAAVTAAAALVDHVVSDELVHASLIDGIRLSGKPKSVIPHQQWDSALAVAPRVPLLAVAESLYSMDGDTVDAEPLRRFWDGRDCFLIIDEAHAAGVFAETGRGLTSSWRDFDRMAVTVTFGKAFGVGGAAILCSERFKSLLVNTARTFIFTTAPPPVVPAMVVAALAVVEEEGWRRQELWERAEQVRAILSEANSAAGRPVAEPRRIWDARSPIVSFAVPGNDKALRYSQNMRKFGVEVRAIRYPTVPLGKERLRFSLNLAVSRENTEGMAREVVRRWMEFSSQA